MSNRVRAVATFLLGVAFLVAGVVLSQVRRPVGLDSLFLEVRSGEYTGEYVIPIEAQDFRAGQETVYLSGEARMVLVPGDLVDSVNALIASHRSAEPAPALTEPDSAIARDVPSSDLMDPAVWTALPETPLLAPRDLTLVIVGGLVLLSALGLLIVRGPLPPQAFWALRIITALGAAACGVGLGGAVSVGLNISGALVRAGGGVGLFLAVFFLNPRPLEPASANGPTGSS